MTAGIESGSDGRGSVRAPSGPGIVRAFRRSPVGTLTGLAEAHPDAVALRLGPERVLLVNDATAAWSLLTSHAQHTSKGRGLARARLVIGDGLLTSEGREHRDSRRRLGPAFAATRVQDYADCFLAAAAAVWGDDPPHPPMSSRRWRSASSTADRWSDGQPVDLVAEAAALTLDAAGRALFGTDLRPQAPAVAAALTDLLDNFWTAMVPGGRLLLRLPLPAARRVRAARSALVAVVDELVGARRRGGSSPHTDTGPDVLDLLLADPPLSDQQVRDELVTLLLAGHETTALALVWTLGAVDADPDLRERLEAEWSVGPPTRAAELATALPLTTATVAEALRLWPPSWAISRRVLAPFELAGRAVAPGTLAVVSPLSLHRDRRWWADPEHFHPERWLDADGAFDRRAPGVPRGAYLPFGAGPRICVGEHLVWAEAVTLLAALGRSWRVHLDAPLALGRPALTLRPRAPVLGTVRRR